MRPPLYKVRWSEMRESGLNTLTTDPISRIDADTFADRLLSRPEVEEVSIIVCINRG